MFGAGVCMGVCGCVCVCALQWERPRDWQSDNGATMRSMFKEIYVFVPFNSDFPAFNSPFNAAGVNLQQLWPTTIVLFSTNTHTHTIYESLLTVRQRSGDVRKNQAIIPELGRESLRRTHTLSLPRDCGGGAQLVTSGCILEMFTFPKCRKTTQKKKNMRDKILKNTAGARRLIKERASHYCHNPSPTITDIWC